MVNEAIREYNNITKMISEIFQFCVRHSGSKFIIAEDETITSAMITFCEERKVPIFSDVCEISDYGFYFLNNIVKVKTFSNCGALVSILLENDMSRIQDIAEDVSTLEVRMNMNGAACDTYWGKTQETAKPTYPTVECFLMNKELKPIFLNTFLVAEKEIDIICPWINGLVVNEKLINLLKQALSRGVRIKITYGIGNDGDDARQKTSEKTVDMLKKRFSWSPLLFFNKGNTHIKCLICDDKYMMCGSYNFLSFAADYDDNDVRDEGVEYIVNRDQIVQRRKQLFAWE